MAVDPRRARLAPRTATPPQPPPPPPPPPETVPINMGSLDGPADTAVPSSSPAPPSTDPSSSYKLKFCTVCASNNNRSMEAHLRLSTTPSPAGGYPVLSFGTGSLVRLPGPSISQPNVYSFNTTSYSQMHDELLAQDARLYRNNGILNMLARNKDVKWGPERFQDWIPGAPRLDHQEKGDKGSLGTEGGVVDVIFTCEERCWDAVVDNLLDRGAPLNRPVHVFNIDIRDNHEEALIGGGAILELANALNEAATQERQDKGSSGWENGVGRAREGFDERVPDILAEWQERWPNLPALWTLAWF